MINAYILPIIVLTFFLSLPAFSQNRTLARINQKVVTVNEFEKKYRENIKFYQLKNPSKREVLDDLIKRELGIQQARKLGLDKDPEIRERIDTVLYQALIERQLAKKFEAITVSTAEAEAYYKRNPEVRTSHIFVGVKEGASKAEEQKALERLKDVQKRYLVAQKMTFAEVAQRYSEGLAAPMGGDLDYQTRDRLDPAFYEAALKLKENQISPPVRSRFGWHLIRLTGRKTWKQVDRAKVKRLAFEEKRQKLFDQYMDGLRKTAKVTVNYNLIK